MIAALAAMLASADPNADVHAAINAGDVDAVKAALGAGALLNMPSAQNGGQTPLMHAVLMHAA